jgi:hypothetical protein
METNNVLFTELSAEQATAINGGWSFKKWLFGKHPIIKVVSKFLGTVL